MSTENILAERSVRGEVSLYDKADKFVASYKDGKWLDGSVFDFDYLERNFSRITNEVEILNLMTEARTALGQPLKKSG